MKSVTAPLKNTFVSIKALNDFNGIDLGQSVQALQCGDTYVAIKRLYFKCRNLESNFPVRTELGLNTDFFLFLEMSILLVLM